MLQVGKGNALRLRSIDVFRGVLAFPEIPFLTFRIKGRKGLQGLLALRRFHKFSTHTTGSMGPPALLHLTRTEMRTGRIQFLHGGFLNSSGMVKGTKSVITVPVTRVPIAAHLLDSSWLSLEGVKFGQ